MSKSQITLLELNTRIKQSLNELTENGIWVFAEINEMHIAQNGHCYLELVGKNESDNKIVAKNRATIWAFTFRMLKPYFEQTTGYPFSAGLNVLLYVSVEYHALYGLSLNVKDIDPTYTLGDIARKRIETINQLKIEGVFDMNKELDFPDVPQKLAIISSDTAAGYGDFINQIQNNRFGFQFYVKLFQSTMQGDGAEKTIVEALEKIYQHEDFFDLVIIIRGGGGKHDLSCFDSYWMAYNIAQFPIPIVTGIGHERDESVADLVAAVSLKTPTAAAEFVIDGLAEYESDLLLKSNSFVKNVQTLLAENKQKLQNISNLLFRIVNSKNSTEKNKIVENKNQLLNLLQKLLNTKKHELSDNLNRYKGFSEAILTNSKNRLEKNNSLFKLVLSNYLHTQKAKLKSIDNKINLLNPENVLKRGYSLICKDEQILKTIKQINVDDSIIVKMQDGEAKAIITDALNKH